MILSLKDFMRKYNLKDDTMNASDLKQVCIFLFIPEIV